MVNIVFQTLTKINELHKDIVNRYRINNGEAIWYSQLITTAKDSSFLSSINSLYYYSREKIENLLEGEGYDNEKD